MSSKIDAAFRIAARFIEPGFGLTAADVAEDRWRLADAINAYARRAVAADRRKREKPAKKRRAAK
jgi:hypothetical protein